MTTTQIKTKNKDDQEINYAWGSNLCQTLGSTYTGRTTTNTPVKIDIEPRIKNVKQICQQNPTTIFLTQENKLFRLNYTIDHTTDQEFVSLKNTNKKNQKEEKEEEEEEIVKNMYSGHFHHIIQTENNNIYSCGENSYHQLGVSNLPTYNADTKTFHKIDYFERKDLVVSKIQCGFYQTYFLCENSQLYACGANDLNQLSANNTSEKSEIILIENEILEIYSGTLCNYFFFLKEDGLFVCGMVSDFLNETGQFGLDEKKNNLVKIPTEFEIGTINCGMKHCLILGNDENEKQLLLGTGKSPQNGFSSDINKFTPIKFFSDNDYQIKQISVGVYHSMILTEDSKIFIFGSNGSKLFLTNPSSHIPMEIKIPDIQGHSNLKIYAGCHSCYIYHLDSDFNNTLSSDLLELFNTQNSNNFSDYSIKDLKIHKILFEVRIGKPIEKIEKILKKYSKDEIAIFMRWVYSDKIRSNKNRKLINEIWKKLGNSQDFQNTKKNSIKNDNRNNPNNDNNRNTLEQDLMKLWKHGESKDFSIIVDLEDVEEEEEKKYFKIPIHKFILIARSGLFREMFDNINENEKSLCQINDYSGKSIESLIILYKYFYTGKIELTADHDPILIYEELEDAVEYYQLNKNSNFKKELNQIK
ncbi:secretion-regulating guanine nucleotide exchange factor [Anaeramoeba flamelloides]|uniref:Secretion-regulating guanine nucleotide exchange factor n=1 Tax=Anaeramoeba flamelloides TaxID=1746091 RepID=A0ABQ8YZX3_9EUKA|nr:secretion-regulating guanine nucleotide exchange factor [Anaeramoeba flamelloides]